jgi:hypothetical protein
MNGIKVINNPKIYISLTADDWHLYDGVGYHLRDKVVKDLNANIQHILNDPNGTEREKKQVCWNYLRMYDYYGASDTEGMQVLDNIFREFFGPTYEGIVT